MLPISSVYFSLWGCDNVGTRFCANSSYNCRLPVTVSLSSNPVADFQWREFFCLSIIIILLFVFLGCYFPLYCLWFDLLGDKEMFSSR